MNDPKSYAEFLNSEEQTPPAGLTQRITQRVREDLNPPAWQVFTKQGAIQLLVGTIVLLFCPQFGINLFPGMGLMALFMRFGEAGCMVGCGSVFLGASSLLGALVLRPEELKVIRKSRFLQLGTMTALSGGVFVCLGGEMVVGLGLAWVLGGLAGGMATLELGWAARAWSHRMPRASS